MGFLWSVDFVFVIASTLQPLLQARGHAVRPPVAASRLPK
jgi:hypothetical protein